LRVTALTSSIGTSTFWEFFSRVASLAPLVARRVLAAGLVAAGLVAAAASGTVLTGAAGFAGDAGAAWTGATG
jgi:hypothetical protein